MNGRGRVSPPPSPSGPSSRPASQPNARTPPPAPPLIAPTGNVTLDCMADAINSTAAPFQNAPPPEQGAAGWVAQGLGGVLGVVGAPQQLIDNAFAGLTAPIAALFPAMPAVTLLGMHIGMMHTHTHPPSLVPPAPPVPLPSIGMLVGAGSMAVLGCGMPLARAGDVGISVTCGSLAPPFEVFTGSSNVFVGGARAARVLDITKHCDPTAMGPFGIAMGVAGVVAGAAGAVATGQAAQAAQAAADAAVLALKLLAGKDPGLPPGVGALIGPPLPTVLIGGFPCPPVGEMAIGALMKGLKRLAAAAKKMRSSRRANSNCADGSHPIYLVTGENFDDFTDFVSVGLFTWKRRYTTAHAAIDGPLGFGFRHNYQRHLDLRLHQATFIDWDGVELEFPKFPGPPGSGRDELREHGYVLRRISQGPDSGRYELSTRGEPTMIFEGDRFAEVLPLVGLRSETHELRLEYDEQGRLARALDTGFATGTVTRFELSYDGAGRIVAIHELGHESVGRFACTYTAAGELHQVRDACNGLWTYTYDDVHRWTSQSDPLGYTYSFRYDEEGRCVWASGQDGLWQAEVEYFPDKFFTKYTEGDGGVWEYHYDPYGFITKIVTPLSGERLRERSPDGRILRDIDPGGRELVFLYDADDALIGRRDHFGYVHPPEGDSPLLRDPFTRQLPKHSLGLIFAGAVEVRAAAMRGATGQLLEIPPELRALAHSVFRLQAPGSSSTPIEPRSYRDALGREVYTLDGLQRATRRQHDAAGNLVALADSDGRVYRWETTSWNLRGAEVDPLGNTTRFQYSPIEQVTALSDPLGNVTRWGYDLGQRLTKVWRDERLRDVYEYDLGDHLVAKYDGSGEVIFRNTEFHSNHFVARRELASGGEHRYDYDRAGRIIEASTADHEVTLHYGPAGTRLADLRDGEGLRRWVSDQVEVNTVLGRFVWTSERSREGLRITAPNGEVSLLRIGDDGIVLRECGNGTRDWMQFDHEGRLEGRMTARRNASGRSVGWGTRYSYSPAGDLLGIQDSARGTLTYTVDECHRLVSVSDGNGERHYAYDAADNLIASPGVSRLALERGNRAAATATEVFEHDERDRLCGRRHRDGAWARYSYDSFDMLESVELGDGDGAPRKWRAAYDAIGRRLWTEIDGRRQEFYWDGDRLAAEVRSDGHLRVYLYAGADSLVPLAFVDYEERDSPPTEGRVYHVFTNPVGMTLHIEDASREIVWWATHIDPYGTVEVHASAELEYNLRWPGHYHDRDIGLYYNRYRYYDPRLGRYISPDPIGHRGSPTNLYAYCANPVVDVDLLGLAHRQSGSEGSRRSTSGDTDGTDRPPRAPEDPPSRARLADMDDAQLQRHCADVADELYQTYRGNGFDQGTIAVTCIQDGSDTSTRRLIVTSEAGEQRAPSRLQPQLDAHDAEWRSGPPDLTSRRPVLDDNGQPVRERNPETNRMRGVYEDSDSGQGRFYERGTDDQGNTTYEPYSKRNRHNPDGETRHHAEQRALNSLEPGEEVAAVGPSRDCCSGCRAELQNRGLLDRVPEHRRGG